MLKSALRWIPKRKDAGQADEVLLLQADGVNVVIRDAYARNPTRTIPQEEFLAVYKPAGHLAEGEDMKLAYFRMEGGPVVIGFHKDEDLGGYALPYLTRDVLEALCENSVDGFHSEDGHLRYDRELVLAFPIRACVDGAEYTVYPAAFDLSWILVTPYDMESMDEETRRQYKNAFRPAGIPEQYLMPPPAENALPAGIEARRFGAHGYRLFRVRPRRNDVEVGRGLTLEEAIENAEANGWGS